MEQDNTILCRLRNSLDTLAPRTLVPNIMKQLGLEGEGVSSDTHLDDLSLLLRNEDWQLRLSAVRRLRLLGPESDQLLLFASQDEHAFVRLVAEHALELRGKPIARENNETKDTVKDDTNLLRDGSSPEDFGGVRASKTKPHEAHQHFIGRQKELAVFKQWLTDPSPEAPWILYFHDHEESVEKKGGVGKTWLLSACTQLARRIYPDMVTVSVDFFNVADRDPVVIANRVIGAVEEAFPDWPDAELMQAQEAYHLAVQEGKENTSEVRIRLSDALIADLRHLDERLAEDRKHLLVFYDTYELIESNPSVSLLSLPKVFPGDFEHIGVVCAGRNKLDWNHPYWQGREQEVACVPVAPFSPDEVLQYFDQLGRMNRKIEPKDLQYIYQRSSGRPILVGLINDVMNWRLSDLKTLAAIPEDQFEASLVSKVNQLYEPINWVVLFMAHAYHRFNFVLLDWICSETPFIDLLRDTTEEQISQQLLSLSFVRRPSNGDDFVLHDEMRRLVTSYCWGAVDPDRRLRKSVSRAAIRYYEEELKTVQQEYTRQAYTVELLYHKLYLDLDEGYSFFRNHFWQAVYCHFDAFAHSLLQEIQFFADRLTPGQRYELKDTEMPLLSKKAHPVEIFCSYSHEDTIWWQKLETHLSPLKQEGLISLWHDREIFPGTDWTSTINAHLETASVILLLISSDFLASDYCVGTEMSRALARHERGETRVVPILLHPVENWQGTRFGKLQVLPNNGEPVTGWADHDDAFVDIAKGIRAALSTEKPPPVSTQPALDKNAFTGNHAGDYRIAVPKTVKNGCYVLQKPIGQPWGLTGAYLGKDAYISGRQVVVKLVRIASGENQGRKDDLEHFKHEVGIIAVARHRRIVPIYDYGEEEQENDGLAYMITPYCEEGSLQDWFTRHIQEQGPLKITEVTALLEQARDALKYVHGNGIIHRDIKPSNFLVESLGDFPALPNLWLTDFGLPQLTGEDTMQNSQETDLYRAPEQWMNGPLTFKTDQYQLAVMTYYLLTGQYPFDSDRRLSRSEFRSQLRHQHLETKPCALRTYREDIPRGVEQVFLRALAKQPEDRYDTIKDFINALRDAFFRGNWSKPR